MLCCVVSVLTSTSTRRAHGVDLEEALIQRLLHDTQSNDTTVNDDASKAAVLVMMMGVDDTDHSLSLTLFARGRLCVGLMS
jgi:hypothetical protein